MDPNVELGAFLRSRRARVRPQDAGVVPTGTARRVPGLRREEVAYLAGVSVDYYARMEQGRQQNVSDAVLDAVARALNLDEVEHRHLLDLARRQTAPPGRRGPERPQRVRPEVYQMLDLLGESAPAVVMGHRMDVLATNRLARILITDFDALPHRERNMAVFQFLDPAARDLYADWEAVATDSVAMLRLYTGRHPDDPLLTDLIGRLSIRSPEFRTWWATHQVREKTHGAKRYRHPLVGEITVGYEVFTFAGDPDQTLCVYTPEPGASTDALRLLASWTAPPAAPAAVRTPPDEAHPRPDAS
ncbi:helix-turn-helix transcriptional regulator [Streptomyces sp. NPDC005573]|uniref:helix-turn-helix transcriptional regulator n=1 Tax=Streptomyces sp. NPDC005573 TaxID=3156890 RepID=UPI0033AE6A15